MKKSVISSGTLMFLLCTGLANAQDPGSAETTGGTAGQSALSTATGNTTASLAETLYIGPGNYQIDGTWEIYSKQIWISPDAVITGTGTLKFYNPSVAGGVSSATLFDGNNNVSYINVNMELQNAANILLTDIPGPGVPWNDVAGNASMTSGKDFNFAVTGGDLLLGNHDMIIATAGTLSNYQPSRFVVTNGSGHLVHNSYTGGFTYPVGIAEGDYTPAAINNTIANTIHVMVQNYATSASPEGNIFGIDRTWNIYADNASANAVINLQHNTVTNGGNYNNAASFVTRYSASAPNTSGQTNLSQNAWQSNNPGPGSATGNLTVGAPVAGASERNLAYTTLATTAADPISFFSKTSEESFPLPVKLSHFNGIAKGCNASLDWETAGAYQPAQFEIQQSADGTSFSTIASIRTEEGSSSYSGIYSQPAPTMHYRLRLIDQDGAAALSQVVTIHTGCQTTPTVLQVYPNPVQDEQRLHLNYLSAAAGKATIQCFNTVGQLLYSQTVLLQQGYNDLLLPVTQLSKGMYLFHLLTHDGVRVHPAKVLVK